MKQAGPRPQVMSPKKNGTEYGSITFKTFDAFQIFLFMEPVDA